MSKAEEKADKACPINKGSGIDRVMSMVNRKNGYIQGYKQAEKDLGWRSVEESLPEIDEEVIVLRDEYGTAPIYNVGVGHIVDRRYAMDFNGWNVPGVRYWMPCPKIPEDKK